jgi:hypothetical protein
MAQNIPIVIIDSDPDSINKMAKYIKDLSNHAVVEGMATTFEHGYEMIHKKRPLKRYRQFAPEDVLNP